MLDRKEAAKELLQRERAKSGLLDFVTYTMPSYKVGEHHKFISDALERIAERKIRRLLIQAPPRHGKSQLATIHFPAWYLGKYPDRQIITAAYNANFARDFGRSVRNLINEPAYQNVFPVNLAADAKAANRWHTDQGGAYLAAGVGTGITGRGAHLIVVDDPIRSRVDADSKLIRDQLWGWYRSVLYTRQMPDACIVVIQTRWHDDDLVGRLLQDMETGGEEWELIDLPAFAMHNDSLGRAYGDPLWPDWYPTNVLEQTRKALTSTDGPREWSALYQQRPITEEGAFFQKEWFRPYNHKELMTRHRGNKEQYLQIYASSDYAVSSGGGDYTVHLIVGVDPNDDIYLLDLWRGQTESDEWVEQALRLMREWSPLQWAEEAGQIEKSVGPFLTKRMREEGIYCFRKAYSSASDKSTRARAIQARMSMGKLYIPEDALWADSFLYEASRFPAGTNDDQVDALALIGRILDQMTTGTQSGYIGHEELSPTTYGDIRKHQIRRRRTGRKPREGIVVGPTYGDITEDEAVIAALERGRRGNPATV